mgnify:CR=1 FL=1
MVTDIYPVVCYYEWVPVLTRYWASWLSIVQLGKWSLPLNMRQKLDVQSQLHPNYGLEDQRQTPWLSPTAKENGQNANATSVMNNNWEIYWVAHQALLRFWQKSLMRSTILKHRVKKDERTAYALRLGYSNLAQRPDIGNRRLGPGVKSQKHWEDYKRSMEHCPPTWAKSRPKLVAGRGACCQPHDYLQHGHELNLIHDLMIKRGC